MADLFIMKLKNIDISSFVGEIFQLPQGGDSIGGSPGGFK